MLPTSSYGSASALPPLKIVSSRPHMVEMGVAMREYWKDNLGVETGDSEARERHAAA